MKIGALDFLLPEAKKQLNGLTKKYIVNGKLNKMKELEEGDPCSQEGCTGLMEYPVVEDCSCHIAPPCNQCVENKLRCGICGYEA